MDIIAMLEENDFYIILTGLGIGLFSVFGKLPEELPFLLDKSKYLYIGIILMAAWLHYQDDSPKSKKKHASFQKHVQVRDYSDTSYEKELHRQTSEPSPMVGPVNSSRPSSRIFDKFDR